ncbi:MAG: hypothetical protein P0S95_05480 [Rhabdochlamydiaceae bacterium]|nr:hypothetical protein [Candidatus Amphrikana amoebophyrae]
MILYLRVGNPQTQETTTVRPAPNPRVVRPANQQVTSSDCKQPEPVIKATRIAKSTFSSIGSLGQ